MTTLACDGQAHNWCNGWCWGAPGSEWCAKMLATMPRLGRCECPCHQTK